MSIAASEGERMSSGDEDSAALPHSGVPALPESDPEMAAMLLLNRGRQHFFARNWSGPSTLDGGAAKGYVETPPQWSGLWRCNCVPRLLPLGGVIRISPPGCVSSRPLWQARLTQLVEKPLPTCMPWRSCRSTRPKRSRNCMRVVSIQGLCRNCVQ